MYGCMLLLTISAGCAEIEYAIQYGRIPGEAYYTWLASAYSPVIQFRQRRLEGEGVCIHADGGKGQLMGFATNEDIVAAGERNPDLRLHAKVYQQAFAEGMLKGMTRSFNESVNAADWRRLQPEKVDAPADVKKELVSTWQRGWRNGYGDGVYCAARIWWGQAK